jgi:hypothetical protein
MLISHELLSMRGPAKVWTGEGKSVHEFTKSISNLTKVARGRRLKIIVAFRDPATWCASRYAESSKILSTPSQADFERRVLEMLADEPAFPAFSWLHKNQTLEALRKTLGSENIFSFQLEELSEDPRKIVSGILSFMELSSTNVSQLVKGISVEKINARRNEMGSWRLNRSKERLVLPDHLAEKIREHFGEKQA